MADKISNAYSSLVMASQSKDERERAKQLLLDVQVELVTYTALAGALKPSWLEKLKREGLWTPVKKAWERLKKAVDFEETGKVITLPTGEKARLYTKTADELKKMSKLERARYYKETAWWNWVKDEAYRLLLAYGRGSGWKVTEGRWVVRFPDEWYALYGIKYLGRRRIRAFGELFLMVERKGYEELKHADNAKRAVRQAYLYLLETQAGLKSGRTNTIKGKKFFEGFRRVVLSWEVRDWEKIERSKSGNVRMFTALKEFLEKELGFKAKMVGDKFIIEREFTKADLPLLEKFKKWEDFINAYKKYAERVGAAIP